MCEERLSRVQTAACGSVCVCVRSAACRVPYWPATDGRGDGGREMQRREFLRWMMGLEGVCKWSAAPAPTVFLLQNTHTGTRVHKHTCRLTYAATAGPQLFAWIDKELPVLLDWSLLKQSRAMSGLSCSAAERTARIEHVIALLWIPGPARERKSICYSEQRSEWNINLDIITACDSQDPGAIPVFGSFVFFYQFILPRTDRWRIIRGVESKKASSGFTWLFMTAEI